MAQRETGIVIHFNAIHGNGVIRRANGDSIKVRYSAIQKEGYRELGEGDSVEFRVKKTPRDVCAEDVTLLE